MEETNFREHQLHADAGHLFCAPEAAREIRKLLKATAELRIVAA